MLRSFSIYPANPSPELLRAGSANIKAFPSTQSCTPSPFQSSGSLGLEFNDLARFRWLVPLKESFSGILVTAKTSINPAYISLYNEEHGSFVAIFCWLAEPEKNLPCISLLAVFGTHKRHVRSAHLQSLSPQLWTAITAATTQFCNTIGDFLCDTYLLSNAACIEQCNVVCWGPGRKHRSQCPREPDQK